VGGRSQQVGALYVDGPALTGQTDLQHAVAVEAVLADELFEALAQLAAAVVARLAVQDEGAALGQG
jgi:hypothetical protein